MKVWIRELLTVVGWLNAFGLMWLLLLGQASGWFLGLVVLVLNLVANFAIMGSVQHVHVSSAPMSIFPDDEPLDEDDLIDRLGAYFGEE